LEHVLRLTLEQRVDDVRKHVVLAKDVAEALALD